MEKRKTWQFFVIAVVSLLTLYNILPTIIFYSKPLHAPINAVYAKQVASDVATRVNELEDDSISWIDAFCKELHITAKSIAGAKNDASVINVQFSDEKSAKTFAKFFPKAASLIPFVPKQMSVLQGPAKDANGYTVQVLRNTPLRFNEKELSQYFRFTKKNDDKGNISDFYFDLVQARFALIAANLTESFQANMLIDALDNKEDQASHLVDVAKKIVFINDTFGVTSPITKRYFGSFTQTDVPNSSALIDRFVTKVEERKKQIDQRMLAIQEDRRDKEAKGELIDVEKLELLDTLEHENTIFEQVLSIIEHHKSEFTQNIKPLQRKQVHEWLLQQRKENPLANARFALPIGKKNPYIKSVVLDWQANSVSLELHDDIVELQNMPSTSELIKVQQEEVNRLIMNQLAMLSQATDEKISQSVSGYRIDLSTLSGASSLLALDLQKLAQKQVSQLVYEIQNEWRPTHHDLTRDALPVFTQSSFTNADPSQKRLCVLVASPTAQDTVLSGLRPGSIYVVLRGMQNIIDQYNRFSDTPEAQKFITEVQELTNRLQKRGFIGYTGDRFGIRNELSKDYVFELDDYYSMLLAATREKFQVYGSKRYAQLEFSDMEQRIAVENRIDDAIQEDLLRWRENYQAAQVSLDPLARLTVPKPTKNAYWENFKRAGKAYFRGDTSKILRWGLDLSGGKSVRIALVDHSGKKVTNPEDLNQAVNELYQRINKMGVSDRTIRIENDTILIDFPQAQGLSATDLVKASAMYFHIVNEQFGPYNQGLAKDVQEFLQDVWNEAVVTNQKESRLIHQIAYNKLQAVENRQVSKDDTSPQVGVKTSAQVLYDAGLRLVNLQEQEVSNAFDDSLSMVSMFREDASETHFQSHPLVIVFANFALEGASLENVHTGFDPSKGNVLMFDVRNSYSGKSSIGGNPRDDFYAWTSRFAEEKIAGTVKEAWSNGRGWRMAVILNDAIISAPSLNAALRDHAMISGNFSQREVNKLATDLKAGSLSFTPKILSEQNISPDLGLKERKNGIVAALVGIALVIAVMCGYYRFAGLVACIAVLFNILIIWAVLQNIEMALTLPGIAGIVLTVAMAVDANVLVFERTREEFKISKRIASALQLGYKKAFSAIVDSNLTTIIAALILLQFDSGPIRGFAVTLVIGIVASMFTSLFMTRFFFAGWVQNPKNRELKMSEWITAPNFDFLKWTKLSFILSAILLVVGVGVFVKEYKSIFGMDFTGGYSLVIDLDEAKNGSINYREKVHHALTAKGLTSGEFQIRELGRSNYLRLQLGISLEEPGGPFHLMPLEKQEQEVQFDYQKNPRIVWVVDALQAQGLQLKSSTKSTLDASWSHMSGQFSDSMRNNAMYALILSLVAVLVYIAIRFEWKFALASVLGLVHDVLLTLSVLAIGHAMGMPLQIDLEVIAAIMTIIGYSLNDTIIVFDRVREDMRLMRKKTFAEIVNHALNTTLSRTVMTSSTTLLVLIALVLFGGASIFTFSFVMATGVFLGTLSSLFIAAPILLYFEEHSSKPLFAHNHA